MIKKNDIIELKIESVSNDGNGIGRSENIVVFVPQAAPGDLLEVKIVKIEKNHMFGIIERIIEPSPYRCEIDCFSFPQCGGCSFRHIDYMAELAIKHSYLSETLKRIGHINCKVEEIVTTSFPNNYRNKVQLPVFSLENSLRTGFYAKRSHRIVPFLDFCRLDPPIFHEIANSCCDILTSLTVSAYDELTNRGLLRHIILKCSSLDGSIMLILVLNGNGFKLEEQFVISITRKYPEIKTIVINTNTKKTNVILGNINRVIFGDGYIYDSLLDVSLRISPLSFFQVNHTIAGMLYQKIREYVKPEKDMTVLDLYCGIGSIGLTLSKSVKTIIGVESNESATDDARNNAKLNGIDNARFICDTAENAATKLNSEGEHIDVVIVDPPRKGCEITTLSSIVEMKPKKIVYVSCNPATLARDISYLSDMGYVTTAVTPFDMFPRTTHLETVALIERCEK